jgi:hypothetical protein
MKTNTLRFLSLNILFLFGLIGCESDSGDDTNNNKVTLNSDEYKLYTLIMDYRADLNLSIIPLSTSLCYVAQQHVFDLEENNPISANCNLHSWSDKGSWSECCYTSDHAQASCMWDKPRELTDYTGNGYEIAFAHSAIATPEAALNGWKNSAGHNNVIINADIWNTEWKAIGIGIRGKFAVVWFGHEDDMAGPPNY